jgi:parallel beta-helix repeat protein
MWKVNLNIFVAVCVFMMSLVGPAGAVTHYVYPGESIQAVIDDANDGDKIWVAPGTYNEAIDFKGKAVRLRSYGGPEVTTIDGTGNYHVVKCESGEDANTVLEGFTITGGNANGTDSNSNGGGMYNYESSPTVTDCTFTNNTASLDGGGMYNDGGIYSNGNSPTVTGCNFNRNSADDGGGMYNDNSSPTVTNCTFSGNTASDNGGGIYNDLLSNPTVTNCTFSGNSAGTYGGGMYNNFYSSPTLTNCTFFDNTANPLGGGMYNFSNSNPTITNCILWGDTPDEIYNKSSSPTVTYSDVQGGWTGTGNIDADPLFVNAAGGDLRLSSFASPCVDTGDNNAPNLPPTDLTDNPRVVDGNRDGSAIVDMGAYELQGKVHNITQDLLYDTIQPAIDDAVNGNQIEVSPGTYYEAIDFKGKAVRLYSRSGKYVTTIDGNGAYHVVQCVNGETPDTVLEGFTIAGGNANGSGTNDYGGGMYNYGSSPTVTDCTFSGNSATDNGGGMYNVYSSNPTITNCNFSKNEAYRGGGMYNITNSSPTLTNCTFSVNSAGWNGGGMYNITNSSPTLTNCTFTSNTASSDTYGGGGMFNHTSSNPKVTNCTFTANTATTNGGGIYNYNDSSPSVTDCTFSGNIAYERAGGMCNDQSSPTVSNCIFTDNASQAGGGMYNDGGGSLSVTNCTFSDNWANYGAGMWNYGSSPTVSNCTFSGNLAEGIGIGGGMYNEAGSNPTVTNCTFNTNAGTNGGGMYNYNSGPTVSNCILWGDTPNEICNSYSTCTVTYTDVQGGYSGAGNINADPCFVDAAAGNLRLGQHSPSIDAGDTTAAPAGIFVDADGNPRGVDDLQTPDTGLSFSGVTVDMGAYEFQPCRIPGDSNCDGVVDFKDVAILCNNWLATP